MSLAKEGGPWSKKKNMVRWSEEKLSQRWIRFWIWVLLKENKAVSPLGSVL